MYVATNLCFRRSLDRKLFKPNESADARMSKGANNAKIRLAVRLVVGGVSFPFMGVAETETLMALWRYRTAL